MDKAKEASNSVLYTTVRTLHNLLNLYVNKKRQSYPCNSSRRGSTFSRQSAHGWPWGCQPCAGRPPFNPRKDSWYSFLLRDWVDLRKFYSSTRDVVPSISHEIDKSSMKAVNFIQKSMLGMWPRGTYYLHFLVTKIRKQSQQYNSCCSLFDPQDGNSIKLHGTRTLEIE
jgi:hypothetical protein